MNPDLDDWARGLHDAIRDTIEAIGGDVAAFDHDPLTAEPFLDDFVSRLPWREFETDDWIWLHTQLVAYVGEVLIRTRDGQWARRTDPSAPPGHRCLKTIVGRDGSPRYVAPFELVHEHLSPVPQRIPRLIERALDAAGYGPEA